MIWEDWLLKTHKEIEAAGENPNERFSRIGHRRPLSRRWARSIGMWGLRSPVEIMEAVGGINASDSSRGTFDVFKHRHKLYAGPQFARYMATIEPASERTIYEEWTQAEIATTVHGHAQFLMRDKNGTTRPFDGTIIDAVRRRFHLLPIEVYLYHTTVENLLAERMMSRKTWYELGFLGRRQLWNNAWGPGQPAVVGPPEGVLLDHDEEVH